MMPVALRELMRHADIATTMQYYVDQNAETTAESLWKMFASEEAKASATAEVES
jgi:hypothetical protein